MDANSRNYVPSLAKGSGELPGIPVDDVLENGSTVMNSADLRPEIAARLQLVKSELGISAELENRYQKWLDNDVLWPDFTAFIHGDLYAGHVMADPEGVVSGIIDWSTGHVSDPSQDFSGHMT